MPGRLIDRDPQVSADALVRGLVPPPLFTAVGFDSYLPDPGEPTQSTALHRLREFAEALAAPTRGSGQFRRRPSGKRALGVYLDGGFGVGKTHLLAALWHAAPQPKAYATFVELTHLAGAIGFATAVAALSDRRLLCIDEFELDDPGDTVLVSTMLARLSEHGVALAATSNTQPEALGQGRFASSDFRREIQGLSARFETVRVDGPDYRHRSTTPRALRLSEEDVRHRTTSTDNSVLDDFAAVTQYLSTLHPSKYGALVDGIALVGWLDVHPARDEATALRLVVLADRLYDRQIPVLASGVPLSELFPPEFLAGGYRKKYQRATSRLVALGRLGLGGEGKSADL